VLNLPVGATAPNQRYIRGWILVKGQGHSVW